MKKHAYLIVAHNQFGLLQQLVSVIDDERNDIYIHIDKKADVDKIALERIVTHANLYFIDRMNIVWGGTQLMKCIIALLEEAYSRGYSYYHFISGVDFPIKSQDYIHSYFEKNYGKEFIGFDWLGIKNGNHKSRVRYYHLWADVMDKNNTTPFLYKMLTRINRFSLLVQHKMGVNRLDYNMYKGSCWFSITHTLVQKIVESKKSIKKRYKFTLGSDEIWLQTFIMESELSENLADSNMRYIKWIQGNPSPEILTMSDYDDLMNTDKLFARKFDYNKDKDIIDRLKESIKEE